MGPGLQAKTLVRRHHAMRGGIQVVAFAPRRQRLDLQKFEQFRMHQPNKLPLMPDEPAWSEMYVATIQAVKLWLLRRNLAGGPNGREQARVLDQRPRVRHLAGKNAALASLSAPSTVVPMTKQQSLIRRWVSIMLRAVYFC